MVGQKRRFAAQSDKEIEGLGCLLGICPEFARNLLGTRSSLGIRSENGPDQPRAELSTQSPDSDKKVTPSKKCPKSDPKGDFSP